MGCETTVDASASTESFQNSCQYGVRFDRELNCCYAGRHHFPSEGRVVAEQLAHHSHGIRPTIPVVCRRTKRVLRIPMDCIAIPGY